MKKVVDILLFILYNSPLYKIKLTVGYTPTITT